MEHNILDAEQAPNLADARRRSLPGWFKGICWFFVVLSSYNLLAFSINIAGLSFQVPFIPLFFSVTSLAFAPFLMLGIYFLIGLVGIGLLSGMFWAIDAGFVLAGIQGLLMLADFLVALGKTEFHLPVSLGLAVVFYLCLFNFKDAWKNPQSNAQSE